MSIKDTLADLGIDTCTEFCEANKIRQPNLNIYRNANDAGTIEIKGFATCGYYRNDHIHVAVPLCARMNAMYSWPGFISDRTPYGAIQHELGHHVDQVMTGFDIYKRRPKPSLFNLDAPGGYFSDTIRAKSGELPITSYSPNTMEWFAEIFRLFVTNPTLLSLIRPKAYDSLCEHFTPVTDLDEKQVMEQFKAPSKIYERMDKWIKKSAK